MYYICCIRKTHTQLFILIMVYNIFLAMENTLFIIEMYTRESRYDVKHGRGMYTYDDGAVCEGESKIKAWL